VLERLNQLALLSVARGVGFAALAIVCAMVGFYGNPHALLKFGGLGFLLVAAVLIIKARSASALRYRRTEVWQMLEPHERPPDAYAQRMIAAARQAALLRFAHTTAAASVAFLGSATCVQVIRFA
jgi:hypothetical protein